jgi:hypothetical protein
VDTFAGLKKIRKKVTNYNNENKEVRKFALAYMDERCNCCGKSGHKSPEF